ncbi:hypothetical protein IFM51744_10091 [Aspergillus udagawae]|nr:hypothetical protein IFM51744_10091 [Aspergillus udagawae]
MLRSVFPRNETYSSADSFPIIFAVQNPQSAELLNFRISYDIREDNNRNNQTTVNHDLRWANWSSSAGPYLAYKYVRDLNTTGNRIVAWELYWQSCDEEALANGSEHDGVFEHYYSWWQHFTIDDSPPKKVDLVAATANATCVNTAGRDTCVVTANLTASATRTTPDPCRVAIDADTEASMAAVHQKLLCDHLKNPNPPEDCPSEESTQQLAVLSVSCFLAAFGVVGFALL